MNWREVLELYGREYGKYIKERHGQQSSQSMRSWPTTAIWDIAIHNAIALFIDVYEGGTQDLPGQQPELRGYPLEGVGYSIARFYRTGHCIKVDMHHDQLLELLHALEGDR